jgi:hypothetical protein
VLRVARSDPAPIAYSFAAGSTRLRRPLATLAVALLALTVVLPGTVAGSATWTRNLFVGRAFVYQDPYYTACTAASAMTMLNTIAIRGSGGAGFGWTPYTVKNNTQNRADYRDMTSILAFERAHDTLRALSRGSDAHGWRNALNFYGWGASAMSDPARMVYADRAYGTFDLAVKAAVRAIARWRMPVGVLGWAGGHAQVITGYVVTGADPSVSDAFQVQALYLSDPLKSDGFLNVRVTLASLRSGNLHYRFQAYRETDSPYDDSYTAGFARSSVSAASGSSEWFRRWVIVAPVRSGLPSQTPTPTPTPTDLPTPTPTDLPTPTPTDLPTPTPTDLPTPTPTDLPTPTPTDLPTPTPTDLPTPTPVL